MAWRGTRVTAGVVGRPLLPGSSRSPGMARLLRAELRQLPWPPSWLELRCCLPGLARGWPTGGGSERALAELQGAQPPPPRGLGLASGGREPLFRHVPAPAPHPLMELPQPPLQPQPGLISTGGSGSPHCLADLLRTHKRWCPLTGAGLGRVAGMGAYGRHRAPRVRGPVRDGAAEGRSCGPGLGCARPCPRGDLGPLGRGRGCGDSPGSTRGS